MAPGLASESSDPGTGHTNFHCNVYLETRERKGLRFALARGTPCAPGFLFGLAGACPSGLRAFPAVGFAYTGGCVEAVRLRSEAQPGDLGLGHRSSNFSLESLRKYDLESQLRLCGMPCANAHGIFRIQVSLETWTWGQEGGVGISLGAERLSAPGALGPASPDVRDLPPASSAGGNLQPRGGGIGGGRWGASLVTSSPLSPTF